MANQNLGGAKKAKNDEFYTQFQDIEKEVMSYLEFNPDVFRNKTVLLPCDDPEWSNFTKFFAQNFETFGLNKLISTSYAPDAKPETITYQPTLFEIESESFDAKKTQANGKIFTLTQDNTKDGVIDVEDLEWTYLEGDGDFRSPEVSRLRDEADIIITNPPFSLFREYIVWLVEAQKTFLTIGNMNAITYREVFPLIKENKIWLGNNYRVNGGAMYYEIPESIANLDQVREIQTDDSGKKKFITRVQGIRWFTNLDHGRRHEPLNLMTMAENLKFNKLIREVGYRKYENYDAIEVPRVEAIPSDHEGVMGVPISFLDKYNPDQFEIVGDSQTMAKELGFRPIGQQFVDDYYRQGNKGQINAAWNYLVMKVGDQTVIPYKRILIRHKKASK